MELSLFQNLIGLEFEAPGENVAYQSSWFSFFENYEYRDYEEDYIPSLKVFLTDVILPRYNLGNLKIKQLYDLNISNLPFT